MDLPGRSGHEAALARAVSRALREQFRAVMDALGDEPSPSKLTPQLFSAMQAALQAAVRPSLEAVFLAQVDALTHAVIPRAKQGGIGIDRGIANQRAAAWARQYSYSLVRGITDRTQATLQQQVGDWFDDQRTMGDLRAAVEPLFGPVRADMIAITEVTRASQAGEDAFEAELNALGLETTQEWETSSDELVCPICGPLHKRRRGDGWTTPPPAHVRCRCWTNTIVIAVRAVDFPAIVRTKRAAGQYTGWFVEAA